MKVCLSRHPFVKVMHTFFPLGCSGFLLPGLRKIKQVYVILQIMTDISRAELLYLVDRQREELKTLNSVGKLLSTTTNPEEVIRLLAEHLRQSLPVAACAILSVQQKKLQFIQFASVAEGAVDTAKRQVLTAANELLRSALKLQDLEEKSDDAAQLAGQWAQTPIGTLPSNHIAPMRFEQATIAVLGVFSGKANAFSKEDQHVIDIVADQASAALRNAYLLDELRRSDQLKNELLMLISHELHTPLTSISEGANLILDEALGPITGEQRDFLGTINQSAIRLSLLIEKTLIATQLMTGKLGYTFTAIDLAPIIKSIAQTAQDTASQKGVSLELAGLSHAVHGYGDEKRLHYAFQQLVENAIHATPKGGLVTVRVASVGGEVEFQVSDTGKGIPSNDLERIFQQFHFTGTIDDRKTGGLGLGLFTAKGIIDGHHGNIKLESQPGAGTKVTVRLPATPSA